MAAVDLSFVGPLVSDCYCADNGRASWDPVVLFKIVFLQFLYDLSDRQVEDQVHLHLACKWFAGLMPEEAAPDHTTVCRFRAKLGPEKFREIFNGTFSRHLLPAWFMTGCALLTPCTSRRRWTCFG